MLAEATRIEERPVGGGVIGGDALPGSARAPDREPDAGRAARDGRRQAVERRQVVALGAQLRLARRSVRDAAAAGKKMRRGHRRDRQRELGARCEAIGTFTRRCRRAVVEAHDCFFARRRGRCGRRRALRPWRSARRWRRSRAPGASSRSSRAPAAASSIGLSVIAERRALADRRSADPLLGLPVRDLGREHVLRGPAGRRREPIIPTSSP